MLFTVSDIKSVIVPETILGATSALSGSLLTDNDAPEPWQIFFRVPHVVTWNWLSLFLFDLCNQSQTQSVLEDSVNKPWRAIPSNCITSAQTRALLLLVIPSVYLATLRLGGTWEAVTLMVGTWMYNDLGGADNGAFVRNLLNGFGYICYSSGSMRIATGYGRHELNETSTWWLGMIGGIIFTTLQMQDMPDVHGDAKRGRQTIPLIYGDRAARWSIAIPVMRQQPAFPKPPTEDVRTLSGLHTRIQFGQNTRQYRDISPRVHRLIQNLKRQCEKALKLPKKGKERDAAIEQITIQDDFLHSYWERVYGPQGLCNALVEATHAFREIRLHIEYGDYLAVACRKYRTEKMNNLLFKINSQMQWPEINAEIEKEEERVREWKFEGGFASGKPHPDVPWLRDTRLAADRYGMTVEDVRFEIRKYAKRNQICHSEVKKMIDRAQFQHLGEQILRDKATLNDIYGQNTGTVIDYRMAIGRIQDEYFDRLYRDKEGFVHWRPTKKAEKIINRFHNGRP
ncbi:MAG: hypothetical protein Q9181_002994 [Wetmoreana brouardii]